MIIKCKKKNILINFLFFLLFWVKGQVSFDLPNKVPWLIHYSSNTKLVTLVKNKSDTSHLRERNHTHTFKTFHTLFLLLSFTARERSERIDRKCLPSPSTLLIFDAWHSQALCTCVRLWNRALSVPAVRSKGSLEVRGQGSVFLTQWGETAGVQEMERHIRTKRTALAFHTESQSAVSLCCWQTAAKCP